MSTCHECQRARETAGRFPWYCPKCLWCGARLIARLQTMERPSSEIKARCTRVLNDWMAMGHNEQKLRELAKTALPLEPDGGASPSDSALPSPVKSDSAPKKSASRPRSRA